MKKRGRPLIIGKELDGQVKHYLGEIRKRREVVNVAIAIRVLLGVLIHPTKMPSQQRLGKVPPARHGVC